MLPVAVSRGFAKCTPNSYRNHTFAPFENVIPVVVWRGFTSELYAAQLQEAKTAPDREVGAGQALAKARALLFL